MAWIQLRIYWQIERLSICKKRNGTELNIKFVQLKSLRVVVYLSNWTMQFLWLAQWVFRRWTKAIDAAASKRNQNNSSIRRRLDYISLHNYMMGTWKIVFSSATSHQIHAQDRPPSHRIRAQARLSVYGETPTWVRRGDPQSDQHNSTGWAVPAKKSAKEM